MLESEIYHKRHHYPTDTATSTISSNMVADMVVNREQSILKRNNIVSSWLFMWSSSGNTLTPGHDGRTQRKEIGDHICVVPMQ